MPAVAEEAATVAEQNKQEEIAGYTMPRADVGDVVIWFKDGSSMPAIVMNVGPRVVRVMAIHPSRQLIIPDGQLRHRTDPELNPFTLDHVGYWDYTTFHKRLIALEERRGPGRPPKQQE